MKKRYLVGLACGVMMLGMAGIASAALIDYGNGMAYSEEFDITVLLDLNYAKTSNWHNDGIMNGQQAQLWADQLSFGGYSDWRLPTYISNGHGEIQVPSENLALFSNLYSGLYWSSTPGQWGELGVSQPSNYIGTDYWAVPGTEWYYIHGAAFAVRDGTSSPVPEPATMLLMGTGLAGLIAARRKKK